jgi:hypothetical protein
VWSAPGTSLCPTMCSRSTGIPYFSQMRAVSLAEVRYISSVKFFGRSTKPSCSMPMLRSLYSRFPAWYATSSSRTICTVFPSFARIT